MPGTAGFPQGKQELYTTCMDIDIVDNSSVQPVSKGTVQFASGQDVADAGVPAQLTDITNPTAVTSPQTIAFSASASGPASGKTTQTPSSSATNTTSGQAATESASPTTTDDSFLSVHTASTSGAGSGTGSGTGSFTVYPIGVSPNTTGPTDVPKPAAAQPTAVSQPTPQPSLGGQGNGEQGGQGGQGGGFGNGNGSGMPPFFVPANFTGTPPFPIPSGSGRPSGFPHHSGFCPSGFMTNKPTGQFGDGTATNIQAGVPMLTRTEYDTFTQLTTNTVYLTQYTKRTSTLTTTTPFTGLITSTTSASLPTYTAPAASLDTDTDSLTIADHAVTDAPEQTPNVARRAVPTCSQQHQAFRLRARLPFVRNFHDGSDDGGC